MTREAIEIKELETSHAYNLMILVQPVETFHPTLIVVGEEGLKKGVILDIGSQVPELQKGDFVYFTEAIEVEKELWAVHCEEVISYRRYE